MHAALEAEQGRLLSPHKRRVPPFLCQVSVGAAGR
jgi:hypothetical protein